MPLPRVLVLGDNIQDIYRHFTATRLCPEGPVPVLVNPKNEVIATDGGAGLVDRQLAELLGRENVTYISGSLSEKERIFADGRLMLRIDRDSLWTQFTSIYEDQISSALSNHRAYDAVVISDYGKGAIGKIVAKSVMDRTLKNHIPVFVDAKVNWNRYWGAFAAFPNAKEVKNIIRQGFKHVIQKDGANGCFMDDWAISTTPHAVKDVTGAGDVFLAAFVYHFLIGNQVEVTDKKFPLMYFSGDEQTFRLRSAAGFANKVAGKSVEFVGTHVVKKEEITDMIPEDNYKKPERYEGAGNPVSVDGQLVYGYKDDPKSW